VTHAYHDGAPKCQDALDGGMCRQLPDVSAEGDPNTGAPAEFDRNDGGWFDIGGTSVSAPLWAAMLDLINASSACKATRPLGFAPPTLYKAAAVASQYHANFSDVKAGNNDMFDLFNGRDFAAFAGYDMGSGLGSPHLGKLATNACAQAGANTAPAITSLSPNTETVGSEAPFTIHGTNLSTVTALSIGTYDLPSTAWTIVNDTAISVTNPPPASAQTGNVGPQDGSGRAIVNVSNANGAASPVTTSTVLTYLDGTSGSNVPSVSAASPAGGPLAGGNTTDVYGAGFTDTGPDAITSVTFGGVAASTFTVKSPTDLRVTVPAFSSGTTQCAAGNQPLTDICQAQVIVSNAHGPSATQPILKPDELDSGDCATGCEDYAGPTEYDYVPTPTITSMDLTYLSEFGDSVVTLTGTGFDPLALQWVNFGTAGPAVNQDPFIEYDSISSTQLTVDVIPHALTNAPKRVPVTVESLAGRSAPATAVYAGTPTLNDVSPHAGPTTGGTHIKFTGKNFQGSEPENGGAILYLVGFGGSEQLSGYTVSSDGKSITGTTPNAVAGDALVLVCTVTNCSFPETEKQFEATDFVFFEPGNPVVTALSQKAGPAHGGNTVTITGQNLDNVVAVKFGGHNSPRFSNGGLFASDMYHVTAVVPPGDAGKRVAVQVVTVESKHGGAPSKITSATHYTYRASSPSAPRDVKVKVHHTSVRVSWKKPLTDGGAALTGYRVIARPLPHQHGNAKPPKETAHSSKARSMTLKGLVPGWTYRILVRARNKHGLGLSGRAPKSYPIFAAR
jgi:hypothetical protein